MNETISITADNRNVTFDGKLIETAIAAVNVADWDERTIEASVYAVTDGGFAVVIKLLSSNGNIPDVMEVELVDTVDDVEAVLWLFEPFAHIQLGSQLPSESRKRIARSIAKTFFASADEIAAAARAYRDAYPECEFVKPTKAVPTANRLWKFLRIGS